MKKRQNMFQLSAWEEDVYCACTMEDGGSCDGNCEGEWMAHRNSNQGNAVVQLFCVTDDEYALVDTFEVYVYDPYLLVYDARTWVHDPDRDTSIQALYCGPFEDAAAYADELAMQLGWVL